MTTVINLKDLKSPAPFAIVEEDGTRHEMVQPTVESFIESVTMLEKLGTNASMVDEINTTIAITLRAFPSMTEKKLRALPLEVLMKIAHVARGHGGELVTTDAEKAAEAEATGNA